MIFHSVLLVSALSLLQYAAAQPQQLITTVDDGHNIIAKLPCIECPLLVRGDDGGWKETQDENALLLHISLPFSSTSLHINNAALLTHSPILPRIRASQIPLDNPLPNPSTLLTTTHASTGPDADTPSFGLSYSYSLHHIAHTPALVFRFNPIALHTDATPKPLTVTLDKAAQRVLEIVLLQRPVLGAGDPAPLYEIVRAEIVPRDGSKRSPRTMHWHEWDERGRVGTPRYLVGKAVDGGVDWVSGSVIGLCFFVFSLMGLFIVLSLFCIFGWGFWRDEYQQAQSGKGSVPRRAGRWDGNDVERAKGRFLSPHELGMRTPGMVVGVGKSD